MKKIALYAISKAPLGSNDSEFRANIVTFVVKKNQIAEYINKKLIVSHYDHYKQWCELNSLKEDSEQAESAYIKTCGPNWCEYNEYTFRRFVYNIDELASLFRIMNKCAPVGTSYETDAEIEYMDNYLNCYQHLFEMMKESVDTKENS